MNYEAVISRTEFLSLEARVEKLEERERGAVVRDEHIETMLSAAQELREVQGRDLDSVKGQLRAVLFMLATIILGIATSVGVGAYYTLEVTELAKQVKENQQRLERRQTQTEYDVEQVQDQVNENAIGVED